MQRANGILSAVCGVAFALGMGSAGARADGPSWTGFYVGAHAGHGWADWNAHVAHPCNCDTLGGKPAFAGSEAMGGDGWHGGIQAGANKQLGNFVLGVEIDVSRASMDGEHTFRMDYDTDWAVQTRLDWFGTARVRLGHSFGNLLIYGTGGLAWGRVEADMQTISITGPVTMSELSSTTYHVGWAAGAGAEWMLGPNLSLQAQYLYVDLGKADYDPKGTAYAGQPHAFAHHELMSADLKFHTIRAGLNLRF